MPGAGHPVLDETGEDCGRGQPDDVFFLAGTFGSEVSRECDIPSDRPIFFPIVNAQVDNVGAETPSTAAELQAAANDAIDLVDEIALTVDHEEAINLRDLRAQAVFSYTLANDGPNLYETLGYPGIEGTIDPAATDGYWVLLRGFNAGSTHHVHFNGSSGSSTATADDDFFLDIDYVLTVAP